MIQKHIAHLLIVLISALSFNARASLTAYTSNGVNLVYSSESNISWTENANLFYTLITTQGFGTTVNSILAASPTITHSTSILYPSGIHNVSYSDFSNGGQMSWFGAMAFVNYLSSINYGGSNQWRLPDATPYPQVGYGTTGEFGKLFYTELNGVEQGLLPTTNLFTNTVPFVYWTGTEYIWSRDQALAFGTWSGYQSAEIKKANDSWFLVWAVTPGRINAVPVPSAFGLMSIGLIALIRTQRRKVK